MAFFYLIDMMADFSKIKNHQILITNTSFRMKNFTLDWNYKKMVQFYCRMTPLFWNPYALFLFKLFHNISHCYFFIIRTEILYTLDDYLTLNWYFFWKLQWEFDIHSMEILQFFFFLAKALMVPPLFVHDAR